MKKIDKFPPRDRRSILDSFNFGATPKYVSGIFISEVTRNLKIWNILCSSEELGLDIPFYRYSVVFSIRNLKNSYDFYVANTYSYLKFSDFLKSVNPHACVFSQNLPASLYFLFSSADTQGVYVYKISKARALKLRNSIYFDEQ